MSQRGVELLMLTLLAVIASFFVKGEEEGELPANKPDKALDPAVNELPYDGPVIQVEEASVDQEEEPSQEIKFCSSCGSSLNKTARFCAGCGFQIN